MEKQELIEHCNKQIKNCKAFNDFKHLEEHQLMLDIINTNDNLNKGIDELLKKYENILQHLEKSQAQRFNHTYQIKIDLIKEYKEDLKKLKGE